MSKALNKTLRIVLFIFIKKNSKAIRCYKDDNTWNFQEFSTKIILENASEITQFRWKNHAKRPVLDLPLENLLFF